MEKKRGRIQIVSSNTLGFNDKSIERLPEEAQFIIHVDPEGSKVFQKIKRHFGLNPLATWAPIACEEVLRVCFLGYEFEIRKAIING